MKILLRCAGKPLPSIHSFKSDEAGSCWSLQPNIIPHPLFFSPLCTLAAQEELDRRRLSLEGRVHSHTLSPIVEKALSAVIEKVLEAREIAKGHMKG